MKNRRSFSHDPIPSMVNTQLRNEHPSSQTMNGLLHPFIASASSPVPSPLLISVRHCISLFGLPLHSFLP
ncbi:hypothetical protein Mapa_005490 [Marchantia paleacea]|nr:hypothetical protein Mapa_005490 [Marchantia paleacea]